MSDLRKAAQQALEAMEYAGMDVGKFNRVNAACAALRAALAQEQAGPEPVAWLHKWACQDDGLAATDWAKGYEQARRVVRIHLEALRAALAQEQPEPVCKCDLRTRLVGDGCEVCNPKLAAEFAQQLVPVQEPVAWIQPDHLQKARVAPFLSRVEPTQRCADFVPLYLAPPQRPPLTDEEIDKASAQERDALLDHIYEYGTAAEGVLERIRKLCRAVERAVRGEE